MTLNVRGAAHAKRTHKDAASTLAYIRFFPYIYELAVCDSFGSQYPIPVILDNSIIDAFLPREEETIRSIQKAVALDAKTTIMAECYLSRSASQNYDIVRTMQLQFYRR